MLSPSLSAAVESAANPSVSPAELSHHAAFDCLRVVGLSHLEAPFGASRHRVPGAGHLHLAADNPENVFLVAFKTMPEDSRCVAHILEHTALCGSAKYPVRDPFFLMIRRSLNTFMNAFTASDWTAYPFASTNKQYFDNLQDTSVSKDVSHHQVVKSFIGYKNGSAHRPTNRQEDDLGNDRKQVSVLQLINAYRFLGVRQASVDPLERIGKTDIPELTLKHYELSKGEIGRAHV